MLGSWMSLIRRIILQWLIFNHNATILLVVVKTELWLEHVDNLLIGRVEHLFQLLFGHVNEMVQFLVVDSGWLGGKLWWTIRIYFGQQVLFEFPLVQLDIL